MNLWKKEEKTQTFDSLRVEHARRHRSYFHCHAKVRAYARCGAIRQSVGHNRADSRHGTKYANSTDVGNGPAKTINATDCMCSYIDGSIKISARTRVESGGRDGEAKRKEERRNATWCEWLRYFDVRLFHTLFMRIHFPPNSPEIRLRQFSSNISYYSNIPYRDFRIRGLKWKWIYLSDEDLAVSTRGREDHRDKIYILFRYVLSLY